MTCASAAGNNDVIYAGGKQRINCQLLPVKEIRSENIRSVKYLVLKWEFKELDLHSSHITVRSLTRARPSGNMMRRRSTSLPSPPLLPLPQIQRSSAGTLTWARAGREEEDNLTCCCNASIKAFSVPTPTHTTTSACSYFGLPVSYLLQVLTCLWVFCTSP